MAERLHPEDVWAEVIRRLQGQARTRGQFAGVHIAPDSNADIPDQEEARLVILPPKVAHKRGTDSLAKAFAHAATERRDTANRIHRDTLVFLAADEARLEELDAATRDYLGWSHVLDSEADLDLTANQKNQAAQRKAQADQTVASRLLQTFTWALVPAQPDPGAPFTLREVKVEGQSDSLAERVSKRLGSDGDLSTRQAAATIRLALNKVPQIWKDGHVALAAGYDGGTGRYVGLWTPADNASPPVATDSLLLVRPDVAMRQIAATEPPMPRVTDPGDETSPAGATPEPSSALGRRVVDIVYPTVKTRFFGAKTLNNSMLVGKRVLPVSTEVDLAGRVSMLAHLKIAEGGGNLAPRLYFYDDTAGATKKVHIGFVGPHYLMPNTKS